MTLEDIEIIISDLEVDPGPTTRRTELPYIKENSWDINNSFGPLTTNSYEESDNLPPSKNYPIEFPVLPGTQETTVDNTVKPKSDFKTTLNL